MDHLCSPAPRDRVERLDRNREDHRDVDEGVIEVNTISVATSVVPIITRNESANILVVGWRSTNSPMGVPPP